MIVLFEEPRGNAPTVEAISMKRVDLLLILFFIFASDDFGTFAHSQQQALAFQYRFKNVSIPAAHEKEPLSRNFSSNAAKDYLDLGAELWANQKKYVSCHTHGICSFVRTQ